MMGAPISEQMALMGNMYSLMGNWVKQSHSINSVAPISMDAGKIRWWFEVLNKPLAKWGTAMPIKAMGPVKAVVVAAKRQVTTMI